MIKKYQEIINTVNMVTDAAAAFVLCALLLRGNLALPAVFAVCLWLALALQGFYNRDRLSRLRQRAVRILPAALVAVFVLAAVTFVRDGGEAKTASLAALFLLTVLALTAKYACMFLILNALRAEGKNTKFVIVLGTGPLAVRYARDAAEERRLGYFE